MIKEQEIRKAFCKYFFRGDYLFPNDEVYWERYINLLENDYHMVTEYNRFKEELLNNYTDINDFYNDVNVYKNILFEKYTNIFFNKPLIVKNRHLSNLYTAKTKLEEGKIYLTIDLKEAFNKVFFATMNLDKKEWSEIIALKYNIPEFIIDSKAIRIDICNNLRGQTDNPYGKHLRVLLKFLETILNGDEEIIKTLNSKGIIPCAIITDELIFDITDCVDDFKNLLKDDMVINGIDTHVKMFEYKVLRYECNGYTFLHDYRLYSDGTKHFLRKNKEFIYQIIDELCGQKPFNYEPIIRVGGKPIVVQNRIKVIDN